MFAAGLRQDLVLAKALATILTLLLLIMGVAILMITMMMVVVVVAVVALSVVCLSGLIEGARCKCRLGLAMASDRVRVPRGMCIRMGRYRCW